MTKKEKIREILHLLDTYIPSAEVPLKHKDPFTLLTGNSHNCIHIAYFLDFESANIGIIFGI